jgi:hypothetical protein
MGNSNQYELTNKSMCYSDDDNYFGQFTNGKKSGIGIYKWKNDELYEHYEGQWIDGLPCGKGLMYYNNGFIYDGEWHNGKRNGHGILRENDLIRYSGQWFNNKKHGFGRATDQFLTIYVGQWDSNIQNGIGKFTYQQNNHIQKYEGQIKKGLKHGQGTENYSDGSFYVGQWSNNKKNGYGSYHKKDSSFTTGQWVDDELISTFDQYLNNQGINPVTKDNDWNLSSDCEFDQMSTEITLNKNSIYF